MYLKVGDLVINTDRLVYACVADDGQEVALTMAGGEDVRLRGDDAETFLRALPVYEPVEE